MAAKKIETNKIEAELQSATGVTRKDGQTDQTYRSALARASAKLAEDAWNALSDEAQSWVNAAGKNINDAKSNAVETTIAAFPAADADEEDEEEEASEDEDATEAEDSDEESADAEEEEESEEETSDEDETESEDTESEETEEPEEKPTKPKKAAKANKVKEKPVVKKTTKPEKAAKPAKAPKAEKAEKVKRTMHSTIVREAVIAHPDESYEQIEARVLKLVPKMSKVTLRGHFQPTRGTLKALENLGYKIVKPTK